MMIPQPFEMPGTTYVTTLRYIAEDLNPQLCFYFLY